MVDFCVFSSLMANIREETRSNILNFGNTKAE